MRRRDFIATMLGSAAAWPVSATGQQPAMPVVVFLNSASPRGYSLYVNAFRQGLKEAGYSEGENVAIEYRWAEGDYHRLPALAAELVRRPVAVIVAGSPNLPVEGISVVGSKPEEPRTFTRIAEGCAVLTWLPSCGLT